MVRLYQRQNDMGHKTILRNVSAGHGTLHLLKIETTGLDPETDEIIGIRCVKLSVADTIEKTGFYQAVVKTSKPISDVITAITGIDQKMVSGGKNPKEALTELNTFLGQDAYICGFNTKGFLYPFLFGAAKKCGVTIAARGGFDVNNLARTVVTPDYARKNDGYGIKALTDLFHAGNGMPGLVSVLNELYKRISLNETDVPDGYVSTVKRIRNRAGEYIVFTVADGLILLNCKTGYFEDHGTVFDKVDMDKFTKFVLKKTNSTTIDELIQMFKPAA